MLHKRTFILTTLLAMMVLVLSGCQAQATKAQKPIRVVSSLDFYGDAASQVAGKYGQVTSIIHSSSVDPHDFEPTTKNAKAVSKANIVIQNGNGYDDWLGKLVKANDQKIIDFKVSEDLLKFPTGSNEHVWYNPTTMPKLANELANQFSKLDSSHTKYYRQNAAKYIQSLAPLQKLIKTVKQNVDQNNKLVDVSEPVFSIALAHLGYQVNNQHFAKAIEDGNDPSPADIAKMQADIRQRKIAFLVVNTQESDSIVDNMAKLARKHNVPILKVTESLPAGLNYKQWMMNQYEQLRKIQQGM